MRFDTVSYPQYGWHPGLGAGSPTLQLGGGVQTSAGGVTNAMNTGAAVANATNSPIAGVAAGGLSFAASIFALTPAIAAACPPCAAIMAIGAGLVPIVAKIVQGCGQTCIAASDAANQIEPLLLQNVQTYVNSSPRYKSMQAAALANFDQTFAKLTAACQQIGGPGGKNCISDRVAGACKWKASPGSWSPNSDGSHTWNPAGASGSGSSCWNWFIGYRDPIANDPDVQPDPAGLFTPSSSGGVLDSITSLFSSSGGNSNTLMLVALGALAVYFIAGDN